MKLNIIGILTTVLLCGAAIPAFTQEIYPPPTSTVSVNLNPPQDYRHFSPGMLEKQYDYFISTLTFEVPDDHNIMLIIFNTARGAYSMSALYVDGAVISHEDAAEIGTEQVWYPGYDANGDPILVTESHFIGAGFDDPINSMPPGVSGPFNWFENVEPAGGFEERAGVFDYTWAWNYSGLATHQEAAQADDGTPVVETVDEATATCSISVAWHIRHLFDETIIKNFPDIGRFSWLPGIPFNGQYKRIRGTIIRQNP